MNAIEIKIRPDALLLSSALSAVQAYAAHFFKNQKDKDIERIIPATDQGDVLMMQKMLNHVVDYGSLVSYGPFTELLEIVRGFDPDQKLG